MLSDIEVISVHDSDSASESSESVRQEPVESSESESESEQEQEQEQRRQQPSESTQDVFQSPKEKPQKKRKVHVSPIRDQTPLNECIICMGNWSSTGTHRTASLKCGHLFGSKCIKLWLKDKGKNGICPICKAPAKSNDVRHVFALNLTAVDTSDLCKAYQVRDTALLQLSIVQKENEELKLKLREWERCMKSGFGMMGSGADAKYRVMANVMLTKGTVRVGASSWDHTGYLYVAHALTATEFGVTKIDVENRMQRVFTPLHSAMVRDVKVRSRNGVRDTLLTIGLDKKMKLYSYETSDYNMSIDLPTPGWSCTFDTLRDNILYAGSGTASKILMYDTRNPSTPLKTLQDAPPLGRPGSGVHSLYHVESTNALVGGTLHTSFWVQNLSSDPMQCFSAGEGVRCVDTFRGGEQCSGVWFDCGSRVLFSSWRKSGGGVGGGVGKGTHVVERRRDGDGGFEHVAEFDTALYTTLNRNRCFERRSGGGGGTSGVGGLVFMTGGEGQVLVNSVNDVGCVREVQRLGVETGAKVMDVVPFGRSGCVAVLTDSKVHVWQ